MELFTLLFPTANGCACSIHLQSLHRRSDVESPLVEMQGLNHATSGERAESVARHTHELRCESMQLSFKQLTYCIQDQVRS